MSEIEFSIVTTTDELPLCTDPDQPCTYLLMSGTRGLGLSPRDAMFTEGAGDGAIYQGTRLLARSPRLEIRTYGANRREVELNLARLAAAFRERAQPRLTATYSTGETYELPFRLSGGGEDAWLPESSETQTTWVLDLTCPDPLWTARDARTFRASAEEAADELQDDLAAMVLGSSAVISSITVTNPGDEDAFIDWIITGPANGNVHAEIGGVGFTFSAVLTDTQSRTIDGRAKTIVDGAGTRKYSEFAAAPKFPMLPPGQSLITVTMEGADPGDWEVDTDTVLYTNRCIEPALRGGHTTWDTWSDGNGTETWATTGFNGTTGGYGQVAFTATHPAKTAIMFDVDCAASDVVSAVMHVIVNQSKTLQAGFWYFDGTGDVIAAVFGPWIDAPANVYTKIGIPASVLGGAPAGTVSARFVISTVPSASDDWTNGGWMRAGFGAVTDTPDLMYFDGVTLIDGRQQTGWAGTANASESLLYALERVGQSSVAGRFRPRKALVY